MNWRLIEHEVLVKICKRINIPAKREGKKTYYALGKTEVGCQLRDTLKLIYCGKIMGREIE